MVELRAEREAGVSLIAAVKAIAGAHPGPHEIMVRAGASRLRLGPQWRLSGSPASVAALGEFGDVTLRTD